MWPMRTRIQQIRARLEAAVDAESYMGFIQQLANDGVLRQAEMDLHRFAPQDISDLLAVVEVLEAGLEQYEQPFDTIITDPRHPRFIDIDRGLTAREALTKAQAILDKGGV